jgi:hypothetical protein
MPRGKHLKLQCHCGNDWVVCIEVRVRVNGVKVRRHECANLHRFTTIQEPGSDTLIRDRRTKPRTGKGVLSKSSNK